MGLFKDLLIGGAALKALKRSDRPVVLAPPTCSVVGLEHKGFGATWKVTYIYNDKPNMRHNFTINNLYINDLYDYSVFVFSVPFTLLLN